VLADRFEQVTLVERDAFPAAAIPRKGVPQARHLHILLARGRQALEQLFPGIGNELIAAGAEVIDAAGDIAWLTPAGWGARFRSGICSFACSRPLFDHFIRRRLSAIDTVTIMENTDVVGLRLAAEEPRVAGVVVDPRGGQAVRNGEHILDADLVVDAGGRRSRTPEWLAGLGFARPGRRWWTPILDTRAAST
jgi:2-polyprenyl-6-methoxyphenol hydroxylase-like FAD-dependent oxidoreductase